MRTKNVRFKFQDILLAIHENLMKLCFSICIVLLTSNITIADNYFTQAGLHTIVTFYPDDNNTEVDEEAVLSDLIQSGIIYLAKDSINDYKTNNIQPIMISKLYNQIIEKGQDYLKIAVSAELSEDKDPGEVNTKEPIYLVTSENIAGMLEDGNYSKVGTADVDFSNGTHSTFDVYISTQTISGYDNNGVSSIINVNKPEISVTTYPNPAKDVLNISIAGSLDQIKDITVINLIGVEVMKIKHAQLYQYMQLNVSGLPQGIYYLAIKTDLEKDILQRINILN